LSGLGIVLVGAKPESEDQRKNSRKIEIISLKEIADCTVNLLIFQRLISVLSLRAFATSSRVLIKDYP
jgi:hypothetical protein